jgi:UDP-glucose 4-epimerase
LERIEDVVGRSIAFYEVDCCDEVALRWIFETHDIDAIIHFAAFKSVEESERKPEMYFKNNVGSTEVVLNLAIEFGVSRFVFSSSCTVYGNPESNPVSEESALLPAVSVYGKTKQACEEIISSKSRALKSVVLRYFNPIGAHPTTKIGESYTGSPTNLVPLLCEVANKERAKFFVFGNDYNTPDGTCVRDYIHVVDLAKAHVLALGFNQQNTLEVFNLGVGKGYSVLEVLRAFEQVNQLTLPVEFAGRREGDVERIWASAAKAESILGWKAQFSLEESLLHAWKWKQFESSNVQLGAKHQ